MRRTEKSLFFTVSLIVVCGFAILSLERYLCGERPRQVLSRTADDELVRAMEFGQEGFYGVTAWAEEQGVDPGEALAVFMAGLDYDMRGVRGGTLSRKRYARWRDQLQDEAFERLAQIYAGLAKDLQVFPIPRNSDPACAFPSYGNDWGNPRTFGGDRRHEGCDIMGDQYEDGTYPVVSMTDGVVEKLGWLRLGGWRVGIRSESGIYYYYAHLDSYAEGLEIGNEVRAGQQIGRMGSTGYSEIEGTSGNFAVHLHVGIYVPLKGQEDISVNPYYLMQYLENGHVITEDYSWQEPSENPAESSAK